MAAGDIKTAWGTEAALTVTLASLATSATFVSGRESTAVAATGTTVEDELLSGKITTGTSPTAAKEIRVYVYGQIEDTPTYPDVLDGTDSAETITDTELLGTAIRLVEVIPTDDSSDQTYYFGPVGLAQYFGGLLPPRWGVFISHNTGVNLNSTGSNHAIWHQPVYRQVEQ
jgi:hypothetical protein